MHEKQKAELRRMKQRRLALKMRRPHGHPGDGEEIRSLTKRIDALTSASFLPQTA